MHLFFLNLATIKFANTHSTYNPLPPSCFYRGSSRKPVCVCFGVSFVFVCLSAQFSQPGSVSTETSKRERVERERERVPHGGGTDILQPGSRASVWAARSSSTVHPHQHHRHPSTSRFGLDTPCGDTVYEHECV